MQDAPLEFTTKKYKNISGSKYFMVSKQGKEHVLYCQERTGKPMKVRIV